MTIDTLAIAIQKDFDTVHTEMAEMREEMGAMKVDFKNELKATENKILLAIGDLRKVTEGMDARFSAYAVRTNEDISKLQGSVKDMDVRLRVVEKRG